jgi:DNA (cytosine-5)-methyltransferase 1
VRYLSVCSGIEAATVAWHPLGFEPVAFAEIEPFPSAVLNHHYPSVPNWGDLTKFQEWPDASVDLLVGGTPCQSFSVAGLRKGMADPRGNLALTYLALADRYRPRWVVWENVPGVLSSAGGRDFGAFLGGLAELGYGFAYRVLDAQYFGLAQRRKRVFVVGHLGDWRRAAAVLFERESLSGHPAPRREAGQRVAGCFTPGAHPGGFNGQDAYNGMLVGLDYEFNGHGGDDATGPLLKGSPTGGGHPLPLIAFSAKDHGADAGDISPTLRAGGHHGSHANGGVMPAVAFDARQSAVIQYGDMSGPLDTDGHTIAVAFNCSNPDPDICMCGPVASVAFQTRGSNVGVGDVSGTIGSNSDRASGGAPMVAQAETLYTKGINHASTQKTYTGTLLRTLCEEVGAEAFTQWGLGILDSLLPAEVLRSRLHGCVVRLSANFSRRWLVYHALAREEAHSEGFVQAMREAESNGRASQGWRPQEQLARELGAYLSELSHPGAQAVRFLRDLWQASEGLGLLREALSAVQEVGRSPRREGEPVREGMQVRRLTVEECEFLQGFPRGSTAISYRGKPAADGPRYKALGNSMAVPCMSWIGRRIKEVDSLDVDGGHLKPSEAGQPGNASVFSSDGVMSCRTETVSHE